MPVREILAGIGVVCALGCGLWLWRWTWRAPAAARFPAYGWFGLAAIAGLEAALFGHLPWVGRYFTPLIWTAYIAVAGACVERIRGESPIRQAGPFAAQALLSMPVWLLFEAYNFRLRNWRYVGVPAHFWNFLLSGSWAFATIFPGIFLTAEILYHARLHNKICRPCRPSPGLRAGLGLLGLLCVLAPLFTPQHLAAYQFGLVWIGFVALDLVNDALGWPSLLADLRAGAPGRGLALLGAGVICGFFWEFWNYWAGARWQYIFPIGQKIKVFEMPAPGFLGFPPFVLECFTLYVFCAWALLPPRLRRAPLDRAQR